MRAADIDDLRVLVEPEAGRKNIRIDWINDVRAQLPVAAGSVRQATLNLLINACAATSPGGLVKLRAQAHGDSLIIEVGDDGPGLPTVMADYLVAGSNETPPDWDGLGLWIVRRLVGEENGSILVANADGLRTVIRVNWPFRQEAGPDHETKTPNIEEALHAG